MTHVGILTNDIEKSTDTIIKSFGGRLIRDLVDRDRKVKLALVKVQEIIIEFVQPLTSDSPVSNLLKRLGSGVYHVCFEVEDIDEKIEELEKRGFLVIEKPSSAAIFDGNKVAFLYHRALGIVEIVEKGGSK